MAKQQARLTNKEKKTLFQFHFSVAGSQIQSLLYQILSSFLPTALGNLEQQSYRLIDSRLLR